MVSMEDLRGFEAVATTIDGSVPRGERWHRDLLQQMGKELQGIRPGAVSEEAVSLMDEFRRFRHRIRNIYSFNLVPERIKALVEELPREHRDKHRSGKVCSISLTGYKIEVSIFCGVGPRHAVDS